MSEKLQKILARSGYGSRREIEEKIQRGLVSVNGKISTLGDRVSVMPSTQIRLDGRILPITEPQKIPCRVLAYYKIEGEICTRKDPKGRPTVFDRLPKLHDSRWIGIGRLDINTSGLLLFTTDGELAHRLMHPSQEIEREYASRIFGQVNEPSIKQLTQGIQLEDGMAAFRRVTFGGGEGLNHWYNVILTEGRNREVRRLWEAIGVQVSRLIRIRYGDIKLPKGLPRGGWKEMDISTIHYLRELVGLKKDITNTLLIEKKEQRFFKPRQIRRAVKRHVMSSTRSFKKKH